MTKQDFLVKLENLLINIPVQERKDILYDYEEHFISGVASGKSESEIASALGTPEIIAKEILADYHVAHAVEQTSLHNIIRAVFATVSLGFFNLMFVLVPFVGAIGVLMFFFFVVVALIFFPMLILLKVGFPSNINTILSWFFTSMMTIGFGTLLGVGLTLVTTWLVRVFLKYLQFNVQIIRGR